MAEYFGIDVAKWNGNINWAKVAATGKQFAILKVTQKNNNVEDGFFGNYVGAITAGISVGVYRYVYAKNVSQAKAEAEAIVKYIKDKAIPCGVWLDMEDSSIKNIGKSNLTAIIEAEAKIIQDAGFGVGIYCNRDWYLNVLNNAYLKNKYPFWIARYPLSDNGRYNSSSTLAPKSYAQAWQYSSKGKVDGISGYVDLDVAYVNLATLFTKPISKVKYYPAYSGNATSIIEALRAVGEKDTSLTHRKKIGVLNGVPGVGSVEGNLYMLNLLKQGKLKRD